MRSTFPWWRLWMFLAISLDVSRSTAASSVTAPSSSTPTLRPPFPRSPYLIFEFKSFINKFFPSNFHCFKFPIFLYLSCLLSHRCPLNYSLQSCSMFNFVLIFIFLQVLSLRGFNGLEFRWLRARRTVARTWWCPRSTSEATATTPGPALRSPSWVRRHVSTWWTQYE